MTTIDCPWCDQPLPVEPAETLRCAECRIELPLAPDVAVAPALPLAA